MALANFAFFISLSHPAPRRAWENYSSATGDVQELC
jgi:hypothetical protein